MSNGEPPRATLPLEAINWDDLSAVVIDGFTVAEIKAFALDSVVSARCSECGEEYELEPDAEGIDCESCESEGSFTSPLVKLGLI